MFSRNAEGVRAFHGEPAHAFGVAAKRCRFFIFPLAMPMKL
jgi:hypothetical protein